MIDTQPGAPRSVFTSELVELHDTVLRMGTFVMSMLERGLQALVEQNLKLAEEVRRSDDVADALDIGIEEAALRLLALQHPMASDLRCVAGAIRIAADLERV
ncbi:MAG TPA: PhoU domain-containing protein, partial [Armatimonadota bacterium]|nr:PhoU domain-containing protein [Armatimonadota bacterium]